MYRGRREADTLVYADPEGNARDLIRDGGVRHARARNGRFPQSRRAIHPTDDMRSSTIARCVLLALFFGVAPSRARAQTTTEVREAFDSLYAALGRGDTAVLRTRLGEELVWTDGVTGRDVSKAQVLALIAGRPAGTAPRTALDSIEVRLVGNVAFLGARRVDRRSLAGVDLTTQWRVMDAFIRRPTGWQLIRHAQTWLVTPVTPVAGLDSASFQPFVGRYEVAPGYVDDVHWERGHLVATVTGYPPGARLVPVSASVFSPEGVGALIALERDAAGVVIGYVQGFPDGRVLRRRKLP